MKKKMSAKQDNPKNKKHYQNTTKNLQTTYPLVDLNKFMYYKWIYQTL